MTDARQVAEEVFAQVGVYRAGHNIRQEQDRHLHLIEAALRRYAADVMEDIAEGPGLQGYVWTHWLEAKAKELRGLGEMAGGEERRNICCFDGPNGRCPKDADFEIVEERTDVHAPYDANTHACIGHVGDLIGTTTGEGYDPAVQVTHWHLYYIGPQSDDSGEIE